ncbi:MAG: lamin tail domain-containing protein [bacterium]
MKRFLLPLLCLPVFAFSQVMDHFTDGNFTKDPSWTGDTGDFKVNGSHQLQLNSSGSDTAVLATMTTTFKKHTWKFWVKVAYNTSANNFARVYLMADTSWLGQGVRGYYLQIGGPDDSIFIVRQNGNDHRRIQCFASYRTNKSANSLSIEIKKDENGNWKTFIDTLGGSNFIQDRSFIDTTIRDCKYFGLFCRYTSSNSTKTYFDDFYSGPEITDTLPPAVATCVTDDSSGVSLTFTENLKLPEATASGHFFLINQSAEPEEVAVDPLNPSHLFLLFSVPFEEGIQQEIRITGLEDLSGNLIKDTVVQTFYYRPKGFDILINEIMYDPNPKVYLPDQEFVELYNKTSYPISLEGWIFSFGNYQKKLPEIFIAPRGYLLFVSDSAKFSGFGKAINLFTSATSLSNEGAALTLKDRQQRIIHSTSYSPDWFHKSFKEEGGWSLEMTDPENPCGCGENWEASTDGSGGTPGRVNSVSKKNPDMITPVAERTVIEDTVTLEIIFSEPMDSLSLRTELFQIKGPEEFIPGELELIPPAYQRVRFKTATPFQKGFQYSVFFKQGIKDCSGNDVDTSRILRAAIPDTIEASDLVINEILFNPASGGSRFVELYNPSMKVLDISTLVMSDHEILPEEGESGKPITGEKYLVFPGDYVVAAPDPQDIFSRYFCPERKNFIEMAGFPVLDDDTGTLILAVKGDLMAIDKVRYDHEMHYPLLSSEEGVSLERLSPFRSSGDPQNWHSASETSGFGTPGRENSQVIRMEDSESFAGVSPEIFSPDNDGRDDVVSIRLRTGDAGYQATIAIFDHMGRCVRKLVNNVLISGAENFSWDGTDDNGKKAPIGFYIVYIETFKPDGTIKRVKKTTILGGKI